MEAPLLVIEAVSPGEENRGRDYTDKREQYRDRGIPEYWLLDPDRQIVTVLRLQGKIHRELGVFRGSDPIQSLTFLNLSLTAEQVLSAGQ